MASERENLRLQILLVLKCQPHYMANQELLIGRLREMGCAISRDKLHIELIWLDQVADAIVDKVSGGVHIASLTGDGLEAVEGLKPIAGIRAPRPDELANG